MYLAPACTLWLFLGIMTLEFRLMVVRRLLDPPMQLSRSAVAVCLGPMARAVSTCAPHVPLAGVDGRCLPGLLGKQTSAVVCAYGSIVGIWFLKVPNPDPSPGPISQDEGAFQLMASRPLAYCAAAGMGFCVNALAYIVIQTSSSLTLKARFSPRVWTTDRDLSLSTAPSDQCSHPMSF